MSRLDPPRELIRMFPGPPDARLAEVVAMMREMSQQTDPQEMVRAYGQRVRRLVPSDGFLALSRRGLEAPWVKITRSSRWKEDINPWTQNDRLPVLKGGLLSDLIYDGEPRIINDLSLDPDDPSEEYLRGAPLLDGHRQLRRRPGDEHDGADVGEARRLRSGILPRTGLDEQPLRPGHPESGALGRGEEGVSDCRARAARRGRDSALALAQDACRRSATWGWRPTIKPRNGPGATITTSSPCPTTSGAILIADVSGHGTPAAVMMAITHTIAHSYPGEPSPPAELLNHVNDRLSALYTTSGDTFVTAFYGVYDPARRRLTYASAGHNPPRLKRCMDGSVASLDEVGGLPLGLFEGIKYEQTAIDLVPNDQIVFYTDGITEAIDPTGEQFGLSRLDQAIENCYLTADGLMRTILEALEAFTSGMPAADDRTILVGKVT